VFALCSSANHLPQRVDYEKPLKTDRFAPCRIERSVLWFSGPEFALLQLQSAKQGFVEVILAKQADM
jgi:hypothetical protein